MPKSSERPPLTPVVLHVLLALSDGPLHGYGIMKRVETESRIKMGPGTVYGSLQRLADAGWVEELPPENESHRRTGRTFAITPAGTDALGAEAKRITRLAQHEHIRALSPEPGS